MGKPEIKASEVLRDIKSGMSDEALKERYKLSDKGLQSLFAKLIKAKALTQSELDARSGKPKEPETAEFDFQPTVAYSDLSDGLPEAPGTEPSAEAAPPPPRRKQCPHCGADIPANAARCGHCGQFVEGPHVPPPAEGGPEEADTYEVGDEYSPWEDRENLGLSAAFFETFKQVLFEPQEFFDRMPKSGDYVNPFIFGFSILVLATLAGSIWYFLYALLGDSPALGLFFTILVIFLILGLSAAGIFINAAVLHLCLMIVGGANRGFEPTYRVVAYSQAAWIWSLVPCIGGLIAAVWSIVVNIIGLKAVHDTSTGNAVLAVFLPLIVCCGIGLIFQLLFGALSVLSGGN